MFHYTPDLTSDVLHCIPDDDDELIEQELRFRLMAQNSRHRIKPEVANAMRIHLDNKNRM